MLCSLLKACVIHSCLTTIFDIRLKCLKLFWLLLFYAMTVLFPWAVFITVSPPASPAYRATVPLFRWVTMRSGPSLHFDDKTVVPLNPCRLYFCRYDIFWNIWETLKSTADGMIALRHQYSWSLSMCIFWLQQPVVLSVPISLYLTVNFPGALIIWPRDTQQLLGGFQLFRCINW